MDRRDAVIAADRLIDLLIQNQPKLLEHAFTSTPKGTAAALFIADLRKGLTNMYEDEKAL